MFHRRRRRCRAVSGVRWTRCVPIIGHNWRLTELAAIAGTSGRTLQRQFLTFVGKTPRAVLRDIGLECARRELLQGAPGVTIMDIALRCGFPHCGRFSIAYRRRYGETPSQTLKRQAVFTATLGAMPSLFVSPRGRPAVAFGPIETADGTSGDCSRYRRRSRRRTDRAPGFRWQVQTRAARYHLAGAIRGSGSQARLTFRLIDTETGCQLWAHRADNILRDETATGNISPSGSLRRFSNACGWPRSITRCGSRRPASARTISRCARMPGVVALDADGNSRALELLERAMELDPTDPLATALAAWAHVQRVVYHFTSAPMEESAAKSRTGASELRPFAATPPRLPCSAMR